MAACLPMTACAATALTIVKYFLVIHSTAPFATVNRMLGLGTLWLVTLALMQAQHAVQRKVDEQWSNLSDAMMRCRRLEEEQQKLVATVTERTSERDQAISRRHEIELSTEELLQRTCVLFDQNPLPTLIYDRHRFTIVAANEATVNAFGYSKSKLMSMTVDDLAPMRREFGLPKHLKNVWRIRTQGDEWVGVNILGDDIIYAGKPCRLVMVLP